MEETGRRFSRTDHFGITFDVSDQGDVGRWGEHGTMHKPLTLHLNFDSRDGAPWELNWRASWLSAGRRLNGGSLGASTRIETPHWPDWARGVGDDVRAKLNRGELKRDGEDT